MFKHKLIFVSILALTAFLLSCAQPQSGPTAEEQANLAATNRIYDEFINQGKEEVFDEHVSPDFAEHDKTPGLEPTRDGVKQLFRMFRAAFPDLHFRVDDIVASGEKVVARATMQGTHQGEFMGMQPTGKKVAVEVIDIFRFANGKIVEHWGVADNLSMMQQLGAMPAEGETM